jgi:hypothetical protein
MTIIGKVRQLLEGCEVWGSDTDKVLALVKNDEVLKDTMGTRWDDDVEGYPDMVLVVLWVSVKEIALKYIVENKPLAFYRPLFEN